MGEITPDVAAYILENCSDLCELAVNANLTMLAHLLSMAMLEAAKSLPAEPSANSGSTRRSA